MTGPCAHSPHEEVLLRNDMATGQRHYSFRYNIRKQVRFIIFYLAKVSKGIETGIADLTGSIVPPASITALASSTTLLK